MSPSRLTLRPLGVLLAALALGGCASFTRSEYQPPALEQPAAWRTPADASAPAATSTATPVSRQRWWESFGDATLDARIDEALARNTDLAAAALRQQRARLQAGLSETALWPTLGASAGESLSQPLRATEANNHDTSLSRSFSTRLSLSWAADLWGKLARTRDAAEWEARATAEDRDAAELSLTGNVATLYWKLAWLNERIALAEQNLRASEQTRALTQRRFEAGAVGRLDTLSAEQDIASQRSSLVALRQQLEETRNAFALLFDGSPQRRFEEPARLPVTPLPPVSAGLPASLLAARPDLRAAELRLRGTLASGDATRAGYYPDLTLTAGLGASSERLRDVLSNPVASLAAELAFPFLNWRQMQLNTAVARADYELAVVSFRQTFHTALGDVENALSARQQYVAQGEQLALSLTAAREIERINETRYRAGAIPLQTWLDAQQARRSAEAAAADNRYNQLASQATLNLALGGQRS
ncbi:MAG: efflux transporter outer membrane subunit [Candidatus Dactylopiibacterium sp.]|nr:efflux transporter outer membrane subunit [Candidatus Dactylopiibacterium sp.]